jgi:hypothetical protein
MELEASGSFAGVDFFGALLPASWQGAIVAEYGGRVVSNLDHTEKEAMKYLKRVYPEVYTEFTRHCRTLSDIDGESDGLTGWLF